MSLRPLTYGDRWAVFAERLGSRNPAASGVAAAPAVPSDAAIVSLKQDLFLNRLEKHLDDYRRGRGYLSRDVAADLQRKDDEIGAALNHPRTSLLYQAHLTALGYEKRARFIAGVSSAVKALEMIDPARAERDAQEMLTAPVRPAG